MTSRRCFICGRDSAIHDDSQHPFSPADQGTEFDPSPLDASPPPIRGDEAPPLYFEGREVW